MTTEPTADQVLTFLEQHTDVTLTPWQEDYVRRLYPGPPRVDVVHVITELGPTGAPGFVVQAQLGPVPRRRPRDRYCFTRPDFRWVD